MSNIYPNRDYRKKFKNKYMYNTEPVATGSQISFLINIYVTTFQKQNQNLFTFKIPLIPSTIFKLV